MTTTPTLGKTGCPVSGRDKEEKVSGQWSDREYGNLSESITGPNFPTVGCVA